MVINQTESKFKEFLNNDVNYSGKELTGVPKNKINAGFSLNMPYSLYISADYYFVDQIPLNDANSAYAESYNLLNAKLGWSKTVFEGFTIKLAAGINNLANTRYAGMVLVNATGFNGAQPRYYYPGLPVNYYGNAAISYNF
jgi:iron complex outermembrane receptor protein